MHILLIGPMSRQKQKQETPLQFISESMILLILKVLQRKKQHWWNGMATMLGTFIDCMLNRRSPCEGYNSHREYLKRALMIPAMCV